MGECFGEIDRVEAGKVYDDGVIQSVTFAYPSTGEFIIATDHDISLGYTMYEL